MRALGVAALARLSAAVDRAMRGLAVSSVPVTPRIGPGRVTVFTHARRVEQSLDRAAARRVAGRYVWP